MWPIEIRFTLFRLHIFRMILGSVHTSVFTLETQSLNSCDVCIEFSVDVQVLLGLC